MASRREAEALISAGRLMVNGEVVSTLGRRADPDRDVITVDGERIRCAARRRTICLHKPRGYVTTLSDPEGRPTIKDLLRGIHERLFPVGRLDLQTSGLLLLTNDGALAQGLQHPRQGVLRVYEAKVRGQPAPASLSRLRRGLILDDGPAAAARVRSLRALPTKTWLEITMREGRRHEVRRLCEAIGHPVDKLCRIRVGPVRLGSLPAGRWRECTASELRALYRAAGLEQGVLSDAPGRRGGGSAGRGRRSRTSARRPPG